jgi:hypothetical protein
MRCVLPIVHVAALVAHQGGWDEVALVGAPILLIIALLALAKRRVDRGPASADPSRDHEV